MNSRPQHMLPKTVILTGATSGVGRAGARTIAAAHPDWHLVLAGRDQREGERTVNALMQQTGNRHIEWTPLELASLASVRAFARDFAARAPALPPPRAVVANAGLQVVSGTTYTHDGFEMTFGVNALGHFLLVNLLLPQLVAPARIVFVSSTSHDPERTSLMSRAIGVQPPRYRDPRALAWPERYPDPREVGESAQAVGMRRYSTSKLGVIFYAYELARRLQAQGLSTPEHPITVNAFDPGPTPGTRLSRDAGAFGRFAWNVIMPRLSSVVPGLHSVESSGLALARLVLDPALESISGRYFEGKIERTSSRESYDRREAAELWEASAELVNLRADETLGRVGNAPAASA